MFGTFCAETFEHREITAKRARKSKLTYTLLQDGFNAVKTCYELKDLL